MAQIPENAILCTMEDVVTIPRKEYDSLVVSKAALTFILNAGNEYEYAERSVIQTIRKSIKKPEEKPKEEVDFTREDAEDEADA